MQEPQEKMDIWLYQERILALEKEHVVARRRLKRLLRQVHFVPGSIERTAVKSQLDLVKALIILTKEETAFFVKLGQLYDVMKLVTDIIDVLSRRDPVLCQEIMNEVEDLQPVEEVEIRK